MKALKDKQRLGNFSDGISTLYENDASSHKDPQD